MGEAAKEKLSSENLFSCQFVPSESDFDKVWMIWEALEYVKNHWNNEFSSEGAFRDMADDMYGVVRAGEYFKSLGKMGEKIRNQQDERAKEALEKAYQSKKEVDEILKDPSIYDVGKIEDALKKFSDDVENVRSEREHLEKNRF